MRLSRGTSLLLAAVLCSGCLSLTPYSEIRRKVPPRNFLTIDGHAVHVEVQGSGEPLILLHGFGESTYSWRLVVPALAAHYRTIAIDLYGFGWTERPADAAPYSRAGQLRMVTGVMDSLGIESATLVGHSYGGALALALAALEPGRVRALVLVDSAEPSFPDSRKSWLGGIALVRNFALAFQISKSSIRRSLRHAFFEDHLVTRGLVKAYRQRLAIDGVQNAFEHLAAPAPSPGPDIDVSTILQPALFVWGAEDLLIVLPEAREVAALLPASEFVTIQRCGHVPIEERPQEVVAAMLPFLERALAPEGAAR
jgi:pimeloyl-ACP methyl ester carboxylesterase